MIKLLIEKIARVTKNRKRLEAALNVKITNRGKEVYLEGTPEDEYVAEQVIKALEIGFPYAKALLIKEKDLVLNVLNIKEYSKGKNLERIRGRIIGTKGKTLQTLSQLSNCHIELKDNFIGVIGYPEEIKDVEEALISIIQGAKQGNAYAGLAKTKARAKTKELDLGLK